jgi:hypothetical protein
LDSSFAAQCGVGSGAGVWTTGAGGAGVSTGMDGGIRTAQVDGSGGVMMETSDATPASTAAVATTDFILAAAAAAAAWFQAVGICFARACICVHVAGGPVTPSAMWQNGLVSNLGRGIKAVHVQTRRAKGGCGVWGVGKMDVKHEITHTEHREGKFEYVEVRGMHVCAVKQCIF